MPIKNQIIVYIRKEGGSKNAYGFTPEDTIKEVKEQIIKKAAFTDPSLKPSACYQAERNKVVLLSADGVTLEEESIIKEVMKEGDTLSYSFTVELKLPMYKNQRDDALSKKP